MASRSLIWTGHAGDGNYANAANWDDTTNNLNPAASPPNSTDFVSFYSTTSGGTVNLAGGNGETFDVSGAGSWTFTGALTLSGQPSTIGLLPYGFSISSPVTFNAVTFNSLLGGTNVGLGTDAVLTVEGASTVKSLGLDIGPGSTGTLVVTGAGTTWHTVSDPSLNVNGLLSGYLAVGDRGDGTGDLTVTADATVTVDSGATLGSDTGSSGTVTISSGGMLLVGLALSVGESGTGTLTVETGGTVATGGPYDTIGSDYGSHGMVTVDGAGSLWKSAGQIDVGNSGTADLTISNHGSVDAAKGFYIGAISGSSGDVVVESGGRFTSEGTYSSIGGYDGGSVGTVTVEGVGSALVVSGNLSVGNNGSGTLDIANDGSVQTGQLGVGGANGAVGIVSITTGGTLTSLGPYDSIGPGYGSVGTVTVDGTGSLWSSTGAITVGSNGRGTLIVSNAGSVYATNGVSVGQSAGSSGDLLIESGGKVSGGGTFDGIGGSTNAAGTVTVDGTGSSWILDANLGVGSNGNGTLDISNDGSVNADQFSVGIAAASYGVVSITTGGTLTTTGPYDTIGGNGGSLGSVSVTGTGSLWQAGANMTIGNSGGGALTVGSGGTVTADGQINVGQSVSGVGTLTINAGGTLDETEAAQYTNYLLSIGGQGSGSVTVTGAGALINLNGNPLGVAYGAGGNGSLTISNGGVVESGTPNDGNSPAVGLAAYGNGKLTITGSGSELVTTGGVYLGRGGTATVLIENNGELAVGPDGVGNSYSSIGYGYPSGSETGGSGLATVTTGGILNAGTYLYVGGDGATGTLNVNDGGIVNVGSELIVGTAIVLSGVTYAGNGSVAIGAGGTVQITGPAQDTASAVIIGSENSSTGAPPLSSAGEITVSGVGALLNTNGSRIAVGHYGTGSLTISQAGSVVTGTPDSNVYAALIIGFQGVGSVSVTGSGSSLTTDGSTSIGQAGAGSLVVQNDATMTIAPDTMGLGALIVGGGGNSGSKTLDVGGTGTALVTSSGNLQSHVNINVGSNGATGTLTVNNGGMVETAKTINIGNTVTVAVGTPIISQSGTTLSKAGDFYTGTGTVNILDDGTLEAAGGLANGVASIVVGNGEDSFGTLNVLNDGALVNGGGDKIIIGNFGDGTMLVAQGATAEVGASYTDAEAAATLGLNADSTGALTVTDSGSTFAAAGQIQVGDGGTGSLTVANAGTVTATSLNAGVAAGGSGVITVTGTGSELDVSGQFTIGNAASAELSILNGATATVGDMNIGLNAGSTGNVDLEGSGSLLHVTGDLNVGDAGYAVLTIGAGTELTVDGDFFTGAHGRVVGFGGTVDPKHYYNTSVTSGPLTVKASIAIVNTGTFVAENGVLELNGPVTDTGVLDIDTGGILQLDQSVAATQTVAFTAPAGVLDIKDAAGFAPMISGYAAGDTVFVYGISNQAGPTYSHAGGNTTLTYGNGVALTFAGTYDDNTINVVADDTPPPPPCFLTGTRIATERGEVAVENLHIGDRVTTIAGSSHPIKWIGTRRVDPARHPKPRSVLPVRIGRDAFGPRAPHRDLYLSPDHAVFVENVLIPAQYLIDGDSIRQMPPSGPITYFHIELDHHDILLAEGLATESYLDTGNRNTFQNGGAPIALHPDFALRIWEAAGYAPLVVTGPTLEAARRRLAVGRAMAA